MHDGDWVGLREGEGGGGGGREWEVDRLLRLEKLG